MRSAFASPGYGATESDRDLNLVGRIVRRMFAAFENVRLSRLSIIMSVFAIVLFAVGVGATTVTLHSVSTIASVWRDFDTGLGRRLDLFASMRGFLGYDGLTQHLAEWQAGDKTAQPKLARDLQELRALYPAWKGARPSAEETQSLDAVKRTLDDFESALAAGRVTSLSNTDLGGALSRIEDILRKERKQGAERVEDAVWSLALTVGSVMTLSAVLLVSLALFFFWFTRFRVLAPIRASSSAMLTLADGNTDVAIPFTEKTDELGEMARTVLVFRENALERNRLEDEQRETAIRTREDRRRSMLEMADSLESRVHGMIGTIKTSVDSLHESANALTSTAVETQGQSAAASAATEEATVNVKAVAAAGTELSASIQEISRQMLAASDVANEAEKEADQANLRITSLSEAATKIGEVVQLINSIAAQTNLLALNATIESARAGDAGKGFAVVAQEVKVLAEQTARATEDIAGQVSSIQSETNLMVTAIGTISKTIHRINEMSSSIAGAVEQQGAATSEIARNVDEAAHGTQEVASNICEVARGASETGERAHSVFDSANVLMQEVNSLEVSVDQFLAELRAA